MATPATMCKFSDSKMKPQFNPSTLRKTVVEMAFTGNAVHLGCAFSIIELLSRLYGRHMRYDEKIGRAHV